MDLASGGNAVEDFGSVSMNAHYIKALRSNWCRVIDEPDSVVGTCNGVRCRLCGSHF